MQLFASVLEREVGLQPNTRRRDIKLARARHFKLSRSKRFKKVVTGGIVWVSLDKIEHRFILATSADRNIVLYDTQANPDKNGEISPLFTVPGSNPATHQFLISCIAWYPVDTGMFVTSSFDKTVKYWDTNTVEVVESFDLPSKVSCVAMSPVATSHALAAAGCEDHTVRLCDPASGSAMHTLSGHRDVVGSVAWAYHSEFQIISGDASGVMLMWDIRRAGIVHSFDQYTTCRKPRPAAGGSREQAQHSSKVAESSVICSAASADHSAHNGRITCVLPTPDGLRLFSSGTDACVRCWDSTFLHNMLVSYQGTLNSAIRGRQMSVCDDSRLLFHPSGSITQVFDLLSGKLLSELRGGHYESLNCCAYNTVHEELYTGANDHQLLVWEVPPQDDGKGDRHKDHDDWNLTA